MSQLAKPSPVSAAGESARGGRGAFGERRADGAGAGSIAKTATAAGMTMSAVTTSSATKMASVRPPMRPIDARFLVDAIPVISRETTSGITVIRIAFTQSVPIGATRSAACSSAGLPEAAIAAPATRASAERDENGDAAFHAANTTSSGRRR